MDTGPKIYIGTEILDMMPDAAINVQSAASVFENELLRGEYSYPFNIPLTNKNILLLGYPQEISVLFEPKMIPVQYERLGTLTSAMLYIDEIDYDFNTRTGTASCSLVGVEGYFYALIQSMKLENMDFGGNFAIPTYDPNPHSRNHSSAIKYASDIAQGNVTGLPFVFPMIKWDNFGLGTYDFDICQGFINYYSAKPDSVLGPPQFAYLYKFDTLQRMIPMFYLSWVLKRVFTTVGFSITGDLFNDATFNAAYILNNYSINKWVLHGGDSIYYTDSCNTINPRNHMPDMLVTDFLNAICQVFNVQFMPTGLTSFEMVNKKAIISNTTVTEIEKTNISSLVTKKITDNVPAQNGINLSWANGDNNFSSLVKGTDFSILKGNVTEYSQLSDVTALNGDVYYIIADDDYYQYNLQNLQWQVYSGQAILGEYPDYVALSHINGNIHIPGDIYYLEAENQLVIWALPGQWQIICNNFVNFKQYPGGINLNLQGAPLVNQALALEVIEITTGTTYNATIDLPHIDAPGRWLANEYIAPWIGASTVLDSPKNTIGLHLMLYFGMKSMPYYVDWTSGSAVNVDWPVPYSSGYNECLYATPTVYTGPGGANPAPPGFTAGCQYFPKVFDWNFCLYGEDGIYQTFYADWDRALLNSVKYVLQVYLPHYEVNLLDSRGKILALGQLFLLYLKSFTIPYQETASLELYVLKNNAGGIFSGGTDIYSEADYVEGGYTDDNATNNLRILPTGGKGATGANYAADDYAVDGYLDDTPVNINKVVLLPGATKRASH